MESENRLAIIQSNAAAYPRNQVLIRALRDVMTVEIDSAFAPDKTKNLALAAYFFKHDFKAREVLFIWPAGRMLVSMLILKYFRHKHIAYDAFTSMYDSLVNDRRIIQRNSLKAFYHYWRDYFCLHLADFLIFDTPSHQKHIFNLFKLGPSKKFSILPVTLDLDWIKNIPTPPKNTKFAGHEINLLFYGTFIPLQGIRYIIQAAHLTRDLNIHFWILGQGQTYPEMRQLADRTEVNDRLTFLPLVAYEDLFGYIKEADICLGIFGDTEKAQRIIPNKVLECAACAKPIITGANSELSKFFKEGESIIYCPMGKAAALADKIRWAVSHLDQMSALAVNAQKVVEQNFSLPVLKASLKKIFSSVV